MSRVFHHLGRRAARAGWAEKAAGFARPAPLAPSGHVTRRDFSNAKNEAPAVAAPCKEDFKLWEQLEMRDEMERLKLSQFLAVLSDVAMEREKTASQEAKGKGMEQRIKNQKASMNIVVVDKERLELPEALKEADLQVMIEHFRQRGSLKRTSFWNVLARVDELLLASPNVTDLEVPEKGRVTVVGDLHGNIDDLATILELAGPPTKDHLYIFNGDFVDRGAYGVEVLCVLFSLKIVYPDYVHFNRGNHEDPHIGRAYGFYDEVISKFGSRELYDRIQLVFCHLPLCAVVKDRAFVCHAGLFRDAETGLDAIKEVPRGSVVRTVGESSLVEDLTWSDPAMNLGHSTEFNFMRRAGVLFGPEVAKTWLQRHGLTMLVRSHQCVADGYEQLDLGDGYGIWTVFSASNYGRSGNLGAVLQLLPNDEIKTIQYDTELDAKQTDLHNKREVIRLIVHKKVELHKALEAVSNPEGMVSLGNWASTMTSVLELKVNWRNIASSLATVENGQICYESFLDRFQLEVLVPNAQSAVPLTDDGGHHTAFFHNSRELEAILKLIDQDCSGSISLEEMERGCELINARLEPHHQVDAKELFAMMDLDNNGTIDLSEFSRFLELNYKVPEPA